jgi:hypothetical protein
VNASLFSFLTNFFSTAPKETSHFALGIEKIVLPCGFRSPCVFSS